MRISRYLGRHWPTWGGTSVALLYRAIWEDDGWRLWVSQESPIECYYRDARIYRIFDGASEIHRAVLGGALMKKGGALYHPYS